MDGTSTIGPGQVQPGSAVTLSAGLSDFRDRAFTVSADNAGNAILCDLASQRTAPERTEGSTGCGPLGSPTPEPSTLIQRHNWCIESQTESPQEVRVKSLASKKGWAERCAEWVASNGDPVIADKLGGCGTWLLFHHLLAGPEAGETRLAGTNYCGLSRLCPFCAHWRAVKVLKVYGARIFNAVLRGYVPVLMTFTLRNGPDLRERLDTLREAWARLRNRIKGARAGRKQHTPFRDLAGMLSQIEIKLGSGSKEWHPHFHCVGLFESLPDFEACQAEWSLMLGYQAQSNYKVLRSYLDRQAGAIDREGFESQLFKDLCEVVKYQCKFGNGEGGSLGFSETYEAFETVNRRERLLSSYGILRGGEWECEHDLVEPSGDEWPFVEMLYRWNQGQYELQGGNHG